MVAKIKSFLWRVVPVAVAASVQLAAADYPDLSEYQSAASVENPLVFMDDFSEGSGNWLCSGPTKTVERVGLFGTPCLFMERTAERVNHYDDAMVTLKPDKVKLTPGKRYILKAHYRTEGVPENTRIQAIASVYATTGDVTTEFYVDPRPRPTADFKDMSVSFVAGESNAVHLRLWGGLTGKVWWDDVSISADNAALGTVHTIAPYALRLDDEGNVAVKAHLFGLPANELPKYSVEIESGNRRAIEKLATDGICRFKLGSFEDGDHTFKIMVLDTEAKKIICSDTLTLFRNSQLKPKHTDVTVDDRGRMRINGKPFMPVGIITGFLRTEQDVKRLANAGFNTVLNNRSFAMDIQTEKNEISDAAHLPRGAKEDFGTAPWREKQTRSLDILNKYNMKFIVAAMHGRYDEVYEHPAVIGYYIANEATADKIPRIRKLREHWAKNSPFRPAWAVTNRSNDLFEYGKICDLLSFDHYPIFNTHETSLVNYRDGVRIAHESGLPVWGLPQFFNWAVFRRDKEHQRCVFPTFPEMRSQYLVDAIMGARIFVVYNYDCAWELLNEVNPQYRDKFWKDVSDSIHTLRLLEPWLMSDEIVDAPAVENKGLTQIYTAAYRVDGKNMVAVVSAGPGEGRAIISTGIDGLRSATGATRPLGEGKYLFRGKNIDSDILYQGEKLPFPEAIKTELEPEISVNEKEGVTLQLVRTANLSVFQNKDGVYSGSGANVDPYLVFKPATTVNAEKYGILSFEYKLKQSFNFQIFWDNGSGFSGKNSQYVQLPAFGEWRRILVPLDKQADWRGEVKQLRIDPGSQRGLEFAIRNLKLFPHGAK